MSAVRSKPLAWPDGATTSCPITIDLLDAVLAIEVQAYTFPWTRGNFIDSIAAGYVTRALIGPGAELIGYFVAMPGFEEMHL
ncbi:MAG: ribosomal-protein-alanine N-acetyltransferase, partial [Betaproteobacteria bacterium]